ncbi:MAG TPA: GAF domain-containing protein [Actinomycetota bacterium]|nr:GAF domain-containing protein [Actinomycetota bacterium]
MKELHDILGAMTAQKDKVPDRKELLLDMSERVVKAVSAAFTCKADEVAILVLTSDGKHLRFIAPRKFTDLGTIPITKRDSIAVTVLGKKSGEAMNNVPLVKHVSFFESVKLRDRVVPIQKMITVPILFRGQPLGVAQISRKGETPAEAGPDFTPADVRRAQQIFEGVAPFFAEARPPKF